MIKSDKRMKSEINAPDKAAHIDYLTPEQMLGYLNGGRLIPIVDYVLKKKGVIQTHIASDYDANFDQNAYLNKKANELPWLVQLTDELDNQTNILYKTIDAMFEKAAEPVLTFLNMSHVMKPTPEKITDIEGYNSPVYKLAVGLQNMLHPTNQIRRKAIVGETYNMMFTEEQAHKWMGRQMKTIIKNKINAKENDMIIQRIKGEHTKISKLFNELTEAEHVVSLIKDLKIGNGGVEKLVQSLMNSASENSYLKLKMIVSAQYQN